MYLFKLLSRFTVAMRNPWDPIDLQEGKKLFLQPYIKLTQMIYKWKVVNLKDGSTTVSRHITRKNANKRISKIQKKEPDLAPFLRPVLLSQKREGKSGKTKWGTIVQITQLSYH